MQLLNDKVTGSTLLASEWNQPMTELQNIITQSGQLLSSGDLNQLGKGIAQYVANGNYYVDIGGVNNVTLLLVGSKQRVDSLVDGMFICFKPAITNTGITNISFSPGGGLPSGLLLKYENNTNLSANELVVDQYSFVIFNSNLNAFILLNPYGNQNTAGKLLLSDAIDGTQTVNDKVAATPLAVSTVANIALIDNKAQLKKNWPTLTYNSVVLIDFSSGQIVNQDGTLALDVNALTKNLSFVWAQGDNSGGRASAATYAANTWYHCFIISEDGTLSNTDAGFDTDINAANLLADSGWSNYKWIGAVKTGTTTDIQEFFQIGDSFYFTDRKFIFNQNSINVNTTVQVITHSPLAIETNAIVDIELTTNGTASTGIFISAYARSPNQNIDFSALGQLGAKSIASTPQEALLALTRIRVPTNTLSQIEIDVRGSGNGNNSTDIFVRSVGWEIDRAIV